MKKILQLILSFSILLLMNTKVEAVTMSPNSSSGTLTSENSPKKVEVAIGKKMNIFERLAFKIIQKKLKKDANLRKADEQSNLLSLLSCIFGGAGLLIAIVASGVGGLLLGIAGLVLGIMALKREDSKTMAIIGIVCGGLVVLIAALIILAVTA